MVRVWGRVRFLLFCFNSPILTRDVTCSVTLLGRKKYEEAMPDEHPLQHALIVTSMKPQ